MGFAVKILADSITPSGDRLTTAEATYPRYIHGEVLTHRMLSRNSASSRAIPTPKMLTRIKEDPVIPIWWGKNEPGMQAWAEVENKDEARAWWLEGQRLMLAHAERGMELGLHKQIINRLVEPWMWITVIISGTTFSNFFGLRVHKDAEPHFQKIAGMLQVARNQSEPRLIEPGDWHLPLVDIDADDTKALDEYADAQHPELFAIESRTAVRVMVSVGRCARVSYLTHDGRRDIEADVALYHRMAVAEPLHASPAEHIARALDSSKRVGNFTGWHQLRKMLPNEHIGGVMP